MNPSSSLPSVVVLPGSGKVIRAFGDEVTVHLGTQETGGKFTMFTDVTPPGGGPVRMKPTHCWFGRWKATYWSFWIQP